MKNILSLALILFATTIFAQTADFTVIKGKVNATGEYNRTITKLSLFETRNGEMIEIASCNVSENKSFGFSFIPEKENIYTIGTTIFRTTIPIYLKKSETINIQLNKNEYVFTEKASKENRTLKKWYDFSQEMRQKAYFFSTATPSTFKDFYPLLPTFFPAALAFAEKNKTGNKSFDEIFANYTEAETYQILLMHKYTPRPKHPAADNFPNEYKTIANSKYFTTDKALNVPFGNGILSQYVMLKMGIDNEKTFDLGLRLSKIPNDKLKGQHLVQDLPRLNDYGAYMSIINNYGKYITTDYQKAISAQVAEKIGITKPGEAAIDFTCTDLEGKKHSLSDYVGKVVYVDVWASWCRPCLAEIPALKKLEKELHDQNIVFMGVSVDDDKEKWETMLKKKQLAGVQVWSGGFKSEITKAYEIGGIPRFMLFDAQGNIVSIDAPRPSDPKLKAMLLEVLKK